MKAPFLCKILSNKKTIENGYLMILEDKELAQQCQPGQFLHIKVGDGPVLLRRPISICDVDKDKGYIKIFYLVIGKGTDILKDRQPGQTLDVLGPLGRGFVIKEEYKNLVLVAGGCGVAPMLYTARVLRERNKNIQPILGYRSSTFLVEDFEELSKVTITTEDGSLGIKGRINIPLEEALKAGNIDAVMACGPMAMLREVERLCKEYKVEGQISIEERMACGVGACLVCACKAKKDDGEITYKKGCKDGPVFFIGEVELND